MIPVTRVAFRFPLIVKHFQSYNSIGLMPSSRVENRGALRARADEMLAEFGGALIEDCALFSPEGHYGSADLILSHEPDGHRRFLEHILGCAFRRQRRCRRRFHLHSRAGRGTGMYAAEDIEPGEVILREEERPKNLVSRRHVERTWSDEQKLVFYCYAWPMNEDTYVMWSERPQDWAPINHACDPSAWLAARWPRPDLTPTHSTRNASAATSREARQAG